ncbi:MAG: HNH endonuclease [Bacteroidia bacterium]
MGKKKKLVDKKSRKHFEGKCYFCDESDYSLLDVHRILPGEEGGRYVEHNVVVTCANCHRKIHDEQIKIDRFYYTSSGIHILHFWDEKGEHWK